MFRQVWRRLKRVHRAVSHALFLERDEVPTLSPRMALTGAFVGFAVAFALGFGLDTLGAWHWLSHGVTVSSALLIMTGIDRRSARRGPADAA